MIAAVRRSSVGGWHLVPVAKNAAGAVWPIGATYCERTVKAAEVVEVVVEPDLIADLLAGVECCRPCRQGVPDCEVRS